MGFFNKTEEEIKKQEEKKQLKSLKEFVKTNTKIDERDKDILIIYIDKALSDENNVLYETDFLVRAIDRLLEAEYTEEKRLGMKFVTLIASVSNLLPYGMSTPNYEGIKECILKNFIGQFGYINLDIYDYKVYSLFSDFMNYDRLMKTVVHNDLAVQNFELVKDYLFKTCKYHLDDESFLKSVISTINGLNESVLDVEKYLNEELDKDRKKAGFYDVSEERLSYVSGKMDTFDSNYEKANSLIDSINEKSIGIKRSVDKGIESINNTKEDAETSIKNSSKLVEQELRAELDDYLKKLEHEFGIKADTIFEEIKKTYDEKIREITREADFFNTSYTQKVLALKAETDQIVQKVLSTIQNPEVKDCLNKLEQNEEVTKKFKELMDKEIKTAEIIANDSQNNKVVKGINRIVVPFNEGVSIPDSVVIPKDIKIIKAYNANTKEKLEKIKLDIMHKMHQKEDEGEIYHEKIEEVIACLLLGEWPYIYGPSGAGKGHLVSQIGELLNQKVIDCGRIGDAFTIDGYIDAQGKFRATPAVEACSQGGIAFFDEFDSGNPETQINLNIMYSNLEKKIKDPSSYQYYRFANEIDIPINPNMRMIAAGNTEGNGAESGFRRHHIDESVKERMRPIYVGYDNRVEQQILKDYVDWYNFFVNFRNACDHYAKGIDKEGIAEGTASTRDASDLLKNITLNAKSLDQIVNEYFVQIKNEKYRKSLSREIANLYGLDSSEEYDDFRGDLAEASEKDIAKQFVKRCKNGIRN